MALIPYPDIPRLPGVPQLNRSPLFPPGPPPVLGAVIALGRLFQALFSKPVWGIYRDRGADIATAPASADGLAEVTVRAQERPVVVPDSIREFAYKQEWALSDFPVEEGGFASYNKVNSPFMVQLRLTKGGSLQDRKTFLEQIEAVAGTLDLYKIVTPERTYLKCNISRYEITRREGHGAYFLTEVDLFFTEIRIVTAEYTSTAQNTKNAVNPAATPPVNNGTVSATPPPTSLVDRVRNRVAQLARTVTGG